jgi:multidrug efflux pump subunit AcrA (membrane-fusion protein)
LENKLKKLRDQLEACKITAPQDGLVVYASSIEGARWGGWSNDGPLQIGSQVYPNQMIMALPDTSEMIAAVRVHEALAGRIRPGQAVQVKIEAAGGQVFQGKVDSIGVMAESGGWRDPNLREYTVKVALETKDSSAELKPAMRVEARIVLDNVEETLTVPVQALYSEGVVQFVYAPKGSRFERVPVRVGRKSDTLAEVSSGLQDGATVLLRQPAAGEVLAGPFDDERLASAGYTKSEDGTILPPPGQRGGPGRGGRPVTVKRTDGQAEAAPAAGPKAKTSEGENKDSGEAPAATTASTKPAA